MTIDSRIKEIRKLCDAASGGTWEVERHSQDYGDYFVYEILGGKISLYEVDYEKKRIQAKRDAQFIAASRTLVPQLLDALGVAVEKLSDFSEYDNFGSSERVREQFKGILKESRAVITEINSILGEGKR